MKIAYLLGSLNRGGAETLLLDIFKNATKNNLNAIGIHRKSGVLESDFYNSGVKLHRLSVGWNLIGYLLHLRALLSANNIEIVHAQQPIDALFARLATLGTKIRIILTFHGFDYQVKGFGHFILRYIIKRTDVNIYVSENQREHYQQKYHLKAKNQVVVYNGISLDKLDFAKESTENPIVLIRTELKLKPETILLGTVGNFVQGRDQFTLCRFLKLVSDNKVDFHFLFIGKQIDSAPDLYINCVEFCKDNGLSDKVTFLGSRSDVPDILKQLDVFLYATHHDTFGIAVVEAMATGIPVFVNDWCVMSEITEDGKYATIYKTGDENDLLREFVLFLQDRKTFELNASIAANYVRECFSIEKHIENIKQIYFDK